MRLDATAPRNSRRIGIVAIVLRVHVTPDHHVGALLTAIVQKPKVSTYSLAFFHQPDGS